MLDHFYPLLKPVQCDSVSHSSTNFRNQHNSINTLAIASRHMQKYVKVCSNKALLFEGKLRKVWL